MRTDFDIAVLGSGFGGSLTSLCLQQDGKRVLLLEKDRHPRFAIGESSTPLANLLLEELAMKWGLPELLPLCQWGTWQKHHPKVSCGLKRGFTFHHHHPFTRWSPGDGRARELLVAASPSDAVADTHWYRPEFDELLAGFAIKRGVEFVDQFKLTGVDFTGSGARITGHSNTTGRVQTFSAGFVVDATGPRGALASILNLQESSHRWFQPTQSVFAHFTGVERFSEQFSNPPSLPYPPDDAAVHHVLPGGWIWVLRFNNGVTSAGGVWNQEAAVSLELDQTSNPWEQLMQALPSVRKCFKDATAVTPILHSPRLPYLTTSVIGGHWALLPAAAGFVDPLLSTGFPLNLFGIHRLCSLLGKTSGDKLAQGLAAYRADTLADLEVTDRLTSALYAATPNFELFKSLTLLYFAAASFSETARRLGRDNLARTFLLRDNPAFNNALNKICRLTLEIAANGDHSEESTRRITTEIHQAIQPIDIAGLTRQRVPPHYPVDLNDLFEGAPKLGATRSEIEAMLARCHLTP